MIENLTLTQEQQDFYRELVQRGFGKRLLALRDDLKANALIICAAYFENTRKTSLQKLWFEMQAEIEFIESIVK